MKINRAAKNRDSNLVSSIFLFVLSVKVKKKELLDHGHSSVNGPQSECEDELRTWKDTRLIPGNREIY